MKSVSSLHPRACMSSLGRLLFALCLLANPAVAISADHASAGQEKSLQTLIDGLHITDDDVTSGIEELQKHASEAIPLLTAYLDHEDVLHRIRAARALKHMGPKARNALPALLRSLGNPREDSAVRASLVTTISKLIHRSNSAIDELTRLLRHQDHNVRLSVLQVFEEMDEYVLAAAPIFVEMLRNRKETPEIRETAANILAANGPALKDFSSEFIAMLESKDSWERDCALTLLGLTGPSAKRAIPKIRSMLSVAPEASQRRILEALSVIDPASPELTSIFIQDLKSTQTATVAWASDRLAAIQSQEGLAAMIALLGATDDAKLRVRIIQELASYRDLPPSAIQAIMYLFDRMGRVERYWAISLLNLHSRDIRETKHIARILKSVDEEDENIRKEAISLLGGIGPPAMAAVPKLTQIALYDESAVSDACSALHKIDKSGSFLGPLLGAFRLPDAKPRPEALVCAIRSPQYEDTLVLLLLDLIKSRDFPSAPLLSIVLPKVANPEDTARRLIALLREDKTSRGQQLLWETVNFLADSHEVSARLMPELEELLASRGCLEWFVQQSTRSYFLPSECGLIAHALIRARPDNPPRSAMQFVDLVVQGVEDSERNNFRGTGIIDTLPHASNEKAIRILLDALRLRGRHGGRGDAATKLGKAVRPSAEIVQALANTLDDGDDYPRGAAMWALMELGSPESWTAVNHWLDENSTTHVLQLGTLGRGRPRRENGPKSYKGIYFWFEPADSGDGWEFKIDSPRTGKGLLTEQSLCGIATDPQMITAAQFAVSGIRPLKGPAERESPGMPWVREFFFPTTTTPKLACPLDASGAAALRRIGSVKLTVTDVRLAETSLKMEPRIETLDYQVEVTSW